MKVHVLVCAWECFEPLKRCLGSIDAQDYSDMSVFVVDDDSSDANQRELVEDINQIPGWTGVVNDENIGATANIWHSIKAIAPDPDDVILLVDGDDWLPHERCVSRIVRAYEDTGLLLTYGNYVVHPDGLETPGASSYPFHVIRDRSFRNWSNCFNHPLSFKAVLWDSVLESDLKLSDGRWIPWVYDEAIMYPMLEMAGPNHAFLPDVLYVYNSENPASCFYNFEEEMRAVGAELRGRAPRPLMRRWGHMLVREPAPLEQAEMCDAILDYQGDSVYTQ